MEKKINLIVSKEDKNTRVDSFINKHNKEISRTRIKNLILSKNLKINNKIITDPSKRLTLNDKINILIPEPKKASLKPYKYNLNIVYEDDDLLVIDKPAGIIMHPGAGNYDNTIVNALINYDKKLSSNIGDELRPGIVHRIDKNTSGLVVVAKK
jgi:Pseudouridylate synthases, 23S RNA-specific